jgi:hypothetical protein
MANTNTLTSTIPTGLPTVFDNDDLFDRLVKAYLEELRASADRPGERTKPSLGDLDKKSRKTP